MIKAIEKCSIQATFGAEITSTAELLPKRSDGSSVTISQASHDSVIDPVHRGALFNKISFLPAKRRINAELLPMDPINEESNIPSDLTANDGVMPIILTNQDNSIASEGLTKHGSMAADLEHEVRMTPFQQSNFFGRVPLEIWGQKVSYHALLYCSPLLKFFRC